MDPANLDVMFGLELVNTNCTEIAPGSDVVGKNFDQQGLLVFV